MLRQLYFLKAVFHTSVILMLLLGNAVVAASECELPAPFSILEQSAENPLNKQSMQAFLSVESSLPAVLNFWAIWCAPCRTELPLLQRLNEDTGVSVELINVGDDKASVEALLAELDVTRLPSHIADSNLFSELGFIGLPANVVLTDKAIYLGFGRLKDEAALKSWLSCLKQDDS